MRLRCGADVRKDSWRKGELGVLRDKPLERRKVACFPRSATAHPVPAPGRFSPSPEGEEWQPYRRLGFSLLPAAAASLFVWTQVPPFTGLQLHRFLWRFHAYSPPYRSRFPARHCFLATPCRALSGG